MMKLSQLSAFDWMIIRREGKQMVTTNQGVTSMASIGAILAGFALPAISMVRQQARQQQSGKNMNQLMGGTIAWEQEKDERVRDLKKMVKDQQMPEKLLRSPGDPERENAYLYVFPIADPFSSQPVIVEDPACWKGKGCMVCFGDGHVKWFKGESAARIWAQALKLANSPQAKGAGVSLDDWEGVQDK
jgi:prepilin-type processing-associated H-X9-DG protein